MTCWKQDLQQLGLGSKGSVLHLASKGGVKPTLPLKPAASTPKPAPAPAPAPAMNSKTSSSHSSGNVPELIVLDDDDDICEVVNYQPPARASASAAARREKRKAAELVKATGDPDIEGR